MSSVSHCVSVLLQTSTGFSVSAPVPLWAAPRQGIWLCSMAFVYSPPCGSPSQRAGNGKGAKKVPPQSWSSQGLRPHVLQLR